MKNSELAKIKKKINPLLKKQGVAKAAIFGSTASGTDKKNSDLDLLIEFKGDRSLLDLITLKMNLEKKLKRKVDLLTYKAIHPLVEEIILKQQVKIL